MKLNARRVPIGEVVLETGSWDPHGAPEGAFIDYVDIGSVDQMTKRITAANRVIAREAPSRARQLVRADDVLVSTVRPNLNAVALVPPEYDHATASTGFTVLRADVGRLSPRYLFRWATSPAFVRDMTRRATGASYPAVSDAIVKESEIPLPDVQEQNRISAILDRADAIRHARHEAIAIEDELIASLFFERFGDPTSNARGWKVVGLSEICTKITDGVHARPHYTQDGIPFISVKDITTGRLTFAGCKYIAPEDHREFTSRCRPESGDILYTKVGATYGRPALVETEEEFSLYVSVALLKPDRARVNPRFLREVLATPFVKRQADRSVKGAGVPDLHLVEIKKFLVPLPPMSVQDDFVRVANRIHAHFEMQRAAAMEADHLFNSLVQRAFSGDLTSDQSKAAHPAL